MLIQCNFMSSWNCKLMSDSPRFTWTSDWYSYICTRLGMPTVCYGYGGTQYGSPTVWWDLDPFCRARSALMVQNTKSVRDWVDVFFASLSFLDHFSSREIGKWWFFLSRHTHTWPYHNRRDQQDTVCTACTWGHLPYRTCAVGRGSKHQTVHVCVCYVNPFSP